MTIRSGRLEAVDASGEAVAAALGATRAGGGWMCKCPSHADRTPSLHLSVGTDGRLLVKCFGGCSQTEVIAALRGLGLWPGGDCDRDRRRRILPAVRAKEDDPDRARARLALAIWRRSSPATGTFVETYLAGRGLTLPIPPTIRFHPGLRHNPSGRRLPAMVAAVQGVDGRLLGVHRTYLRDGGSGKADVERAKMALGPVGGGAVRLASPGPELHVGEGIETCMAAMLATTAPTWAALSTSGLKALVLPETTREVMILADADEPGERAAQAAAARWCRQGILVRIARPLNGGDFADLLVGTAA